MWSSTFLDKSGKPVLGLQQQDFELLDNKKPQRIASFHAVDGVKSDAPVEVLLVVDAINNGFTKVSFARDQIEKFLRRDGGNLSRPISLAFLTASGMTFGSSSSRDGNAVADELNRKLPGLRTINQDQGIYSADQRVRLSLDGIQQLIQFEPSRPGRKLVVWISPGWPLLSSPWASLDLTPPQRQSIFDVIVAFSDGMREARITLSDVDPVRISDAGGLETFAYQEFLKGVKSPAQAQSGNLALQVLALQSGGRVLNSVNDMSAEIAQCVADASAFYEISFKLPDERPAEYHTLEVKVAGKGLTAHTLAGYYAH